jgi:hypothetical protein
MVTRTRSISALCVALVVGACSGGGSGGESATARIDDQVVIDPELVAEARERADGDDDLAEASAADVDETGVDETAPPTEPGAADTGAEGDAAQASPATTEPAIEVAEADEDELDSLLNSLTLFNNCLADDGFDFVGAPGIGGATADQFEQPYLQSLGRCATSSNILQSLENFGAAQENRTQEEIAQFNFGLPVFRDCMIGLGWTVGELVPDEQGALNFGNVLEPPDDADGFGTDDVSACRLEAEQYVADNFEADT